MISLLWKSLFDTRFDLVHKSLYSVLQVMKLILTSFNLVCTISYHFSRVSILFTKIILFFSQDILFSRIILFLFALSYVVRKSYLFILVLTSCNFVCTSSYKVSYICFTQVIFSFKQVTMLFHQCLCLFLRADELLDVVDQLFSHHDDQ